ncbi:GHKL domain-containing protein [Streptococcus hongkongensis]
MTYLLFLGLNVIFENSILFNQLFFIGLSYSSRRDKKWSHHMFYGLFAIILCEVIYKLLALCVMPPLFLLTLTDINNHIWLKVMVYAVILPVYGLFSYLFNLDISLIRYINNERFSYFVLGMNITMLSYLILVKFIAKELGLFPDFFQTYRTHITLVYISVLIWFIMQLDRFAKQQLHHRLKLAQQERIDNLENYNNYIESLYQDIRTLKHDSENILISLKDSIDKGSRTDIEQVYHTVVQQSALQFLDRTTGYGDLENIEDSVVRSLLNTKIYEAQHQGIDVYLEIPDKVNHYHVKLLDLVVLISILLDNAIDTARGSIKPFISIVFFEDDGQQFLIIENATKNKKVDMTKLYNSSDAVTNVESYQKSISRFLSVLNDYPSATFSTRSNHYRLRQILEMRP